MTTKREKKIKEIKEKAVRDICSVSVATAPKSAVRFGISLMELKTTPKIKRIIDKLELEVISEMINNFPKAEKYQLSFARYVSAVKLYLASLKEGG